ncbi:MAG: hypothetical protein U0165_10540 [Polyangiaceae bacterium]
MTTPIAREASAPRDEKGWTTEAIDAALTPVTFAGIYAWAISVAPAFLSVPALVFRKGLDASALGALVAGALALPCVLIGAWLARRGSASAIYIGVWAFLGGCGASWLLAPTTIDVTRIDPIARGVLGSAGFVLYALAWGITRPAGPPPLREPGSKELEARGAIPRGALAIMAIGIIGAAAVMVLAWQVRDTVRALFAQSAAAIVAIGLITASARVAVGRGPKTFSTPKLRFERAGQALALLLLTVALGLVLLFASRLLALNHVRRRVLVYDAHVARVVDALSILLLIAACAVFAHGFKALGDREDLRALYDD